MMSAYALPGDLSRKTWSTLAGLNFSPDPRSYMGRLCMTHTPDWLVGDEDKAHTRSKLQAVRGADGLYGVKVISSVRSPDYAGRRDRVSKWVLDGISEIKAVSFLILGQQQSKILEAYKTNGQGIVDLSPDLEKAKNYLLPSYEIENPSEHYLLNKPLPYYMTTYETIILGALDENLEIISLEDKTGTEIPTKGMTLQTDNDGNINFEGLFKSDGPKNDEDEALQEMLTGMTAEEREEEEDEKDLEIIEQMRFSDIIVRGLSEKAAEELVAGLEKVEDLPSQFIAVYKPISYSLKDVEFEIDADPSAYEPYTDESAAEICKAIKYMKEGRVEASWNIVAVDLYEVFVVTTVGEEGGLEEATQILENLEEVYINPFKKLDATLQYLDNCYDLHYGRWERLAVEYDKTYGLGHAYKMP